MSQDPIRIFAQQQVEFGLPDGGFRKKARLFAALLAPFGRDRFMPPGPLPR